MATELEPFCFFCGGNARFEFRSAPRPFFEDRQKICDSCHSLRQIGVLIFELTETDPGCGNPTMIDGKVYYTGRWTVVDENMVAQLFPPEKLPDVLETRVAGLRHDNYARAGLDKYPWRRIQ